MNAMAPVLSDYLGHRCPSDTYWYLTAAPELLALPAQRLMLAVSGRLAFEIVQKAWLAGIPLVAAVSAPSSLAVDLADQAGLTLAGFVRGAQFNIYAHGERIRP